MPKHLRYLNGKLIDVALTPNSRTILTFPPRHGKSDTTSRWFPAWVLGNFWNHRVMLVSYAANFAREWGLKARDVIQEHGRYVFGIDLRPDKKAQDNWQVVKWNGREWDNTDGSMVTTGIGGLLTGRGANIIIVDDPIKNSEEAFSATYREKTWEWFQSTLMSRMEPGCSVIVIMTRWHEDDIVGRLIQAEKDGGEHWDVINLPALAEENDPLGREVGEALWPERYDEEDLKQIAKNRGEYWFSALYQQRPTPISGAMFKQALGSRYRIQGNTLLYYKQGSTTPILWDLSVCSKFTTVDLAISSKQTADFTVLSTWLQTPHHDLALLNVTRGHFEGPDHVPMITQVWLSHQPSIFYIEATAFQLSTVQAALRAGLPVQPSYPDKDKVARAITAAAKFNSGKIALPFGAEWLPDVEAEIFKFPATKNDDITDTFSIAALVDVGTTYVGNL